MLRALRGRLNQGFKTAAALTAALGALGLGGWSSPALANDSDAGCCTNREQVGQLAPVQVPLPAATSAPAEPSTSSPVTREPSAPVTVIELGERRTEAKDAADHLAATPGAVIQDAGGAGQRKSLSLRGASSNAVLVLLDGVPLAAPGESMDLSRIPAAALERIEVLRGAGSRYGPGGMGGVVNLVTRAPGGQRVFGAASQGSFMTTRADVGGSSPLGPGDLLVLAHGLRSDGDFTFAYDDAPVLHTAPTVLLRTNNQALLGGGLARYRATFGATTVDLLAEGTAERRGLAGPVQNPSPTAGQQTVRATASARATTTFAGGGLLSVLGFGRVDSTLLSGSTFGPAGLQQLASAAGAEAVFTRAFGRHGLTALVTAGGEWLRAPGATPTWGRAGVLLGDEVFFFDGRLGVDASARLDVAGPFVVVSPKAGAALHLPLGLEVRASLGQASRPPSFSELYVTQGTLLPNPSLRPERALTADVTLAWSAEKAALSVTGFGSLYEDLISYEYYPPSLAKPFNFQAARVAGLEVEARAKPLQWLDASASYTFLSTQNLRDDPRYYLKSLPFRPAHRVQGRLVAGVPLASARAEVLLQSAQFMNRTESLALPARVFVNVGVSTTPLPNPALTVSFEVKNLLDAQSQDVDGYPLPPRAAFLTPGARLGRSKTMRVAPVLGLFTLVVLTDCVPTGVVCRTGTVACGAGCIDPSSDKRNCGGCGIACGASQQCSAGLCECGPGTTLCNGECVLLDYDTRNCGVCGQTCAAGGTCSPLAGADGGSRGTCGCPTGLSACSNACVATASDVQNCGQCGRACAATQVCSNGVCAAQCASGETDCGGSCATLASSRLNCGACARPCAPAQDCVAGVCVCPAGQTLCGAACVSLTSANTDCGGCGNVCGSGQSCHAGACSYDVVAACYWSGQAVGFNATTFAKGSLSDLGTNPAALALKQGVLLAADGQDRRLYQAVLSPAGLAQAARATQTGAVPTQVLVDDTRVYVVNAGSGTLQTLSEGADAGRLLLDAGVAGGLGLGTVSELNFGMNSFPQGVARAGDTLWVPLYGGYGVGPAAAGQAVVKVSVADPTAELGRVDLKVLDLHAFDGGAPVARPWAITNHRGALYVVLNNLNPDTYAPEGPGLLARIDPGTSAVTVIDLGAERCLNPQWAASVGDGLVVSCGGQVSYSTTGSIDAVRNAGVVLVDAQDHVVASWSSACPADAGSCAPVMPGRFTVRGARVLLGDQNAGRVVVLDVGDAGFSEVRGVVNPLATCPISAVTGAGNVSDLVSLP